MSVVDPARQAAPAPPRTPTRPPWDPRRLTVHRAIPAGRMRPGLKAALIAEILASYAVARWMMSRHDIRDVVHATRARLDTVEHQPSSPHQSSPAVFQDPTLTATRLGYAVTRTLRALPTDSRCLVQALVLSRLLSERGIPSTLIIGARTHPEFAAHAWVELAGQPVLSTEGFDEARLAEL